MSYEAPCKEMLFVLEHLSNLEELSKLSGFGEFSPDVVAAILHEAGKFAVEILSPLNTIGDRTGAQYDGGFVKSPDQWQSAYSKLVSEGWNSPSAPREVGGMGLPAAVNACIQEMFLGANTAFQLCSILTQGAIDAIDGFASDELKQAYLPKLVSGEWSGTMNLTEPQAGSDLSAIRAKAVSSGDHFLVSGQKIFITYGEHELTENIIHLVLARLPDAPDGVRGLSLFLVPKFLVNRDGSCVARNDIHCVSIERKLGIHASPTCTLAFGEKGGAVGYLIGNPHEGLQYMFSMMNSARLNIGIQGIGIAENATQQAVSYSLVRKQGHTPAGAAVTIMGHPDIRRMLGLMKSSTDAARILSCRAAASLDFANRAEDAELRAYHRRRVDLLIPVVKGWATELSVNTASLGIQVHGGMGFIEETGVAQHLRDSRITTIYEGTTGIQALDLIGRKIKRDHGRAVDELIAEMRASAQALTSMSGPEADWKALAAAVSHGANLVEQATIWILKQEGEEPTAAAVYVLELFGIALGAWAMGDAAQKAGAQIKIGQKTLLLRSKVHLAQFFMHHVLPGADTLLETITSGSKTTLKLEADHFAVH